MFNAISTLLVQVNHTNQSLVNYLTNERCRQHKSDPKIRPKTFFKLPNEDILTWIDHFENVSSYRKLVKRQKKVMEARTLLEGIAATWFV